MARPCFLVVDQEHPSSLSTRKLVLETAKYNVITAYSAAESIELLRRFPRIDGAIIDSQVDDIDCSELARELKEVCPSLIVVAVCPPHTGPCDPADHVLPSFKPQDLLQLLQSLYPAQTAEIVEREKQLHEME